MQISWNGKWLIFCPQMFKFSSSFEQEACRVCILTCSIICRGSSWNRCWFSVKKLKFPWYFAHSFEWKNWHFLFSSTFRLIIHDSKAFWMLIKMLYSMPWYHYYFLSYMLQHLRNLLLQQSWFWGSLILEPKREGFIMSKALKLLSLKSPQNCLTHVKNW